MWTFFIISAICISISIVLLIRRYAEKQVEWIIRIATAYAWLTSMCVVALVPVDVWATLARMTKMRGAIGAMWNFAYWSTQLATWIVLPFYQVYSEAGDFSRRGRAWTSVKENALLYGSVGLLGIVGVLILVILKKTAFGDLLGLGIGLSNAFGLILGILLMGYGLVEIPRQLWKSADPAILLKWTAHRCGKFAEAAIKATHELETVITIIYANQRQMRRHDPLRKYMDIVCDFAEKESPIKPSELAQRSVEIDNLDASDLEYNYDKAGLAALRRRLFWAVADYKGARAQYEECVLEALELEAVIKARQLNVVGTPPALPSLGPVGVLDGGLKLAGRLSWVYKVTARPTANKVYAVILVITSLCIIWGEFTIPIKKPDMSPFSLMIHDVDASNEFSVQALTLLPLVYICACIYFTLFRITAFNYNKLVPRATTGAALMQNGSLMCRFAAPTCWNFYHIIRMTADTCNTSPCLKTVFSEKMASMDVLPISNLNKYLPVILVVHCAITALDLWDKLLNCCTSARYRFTSDDIDDEYTEKGRLLISREADAVCKGFSIGQVLHTSYVDLDFPGVKAKGAPKSRGFLSGLFGKKNTLDPEQGPKPGASASATSGGTTTTAPGTVAPPAPRIYSTAAAQAASRWLPGGAGRASGLTLDMSAPSPPPPPAPLGASDGARPLLGARYGGDSAPPSASASDGASSSGLDGIFAGLMGGGGGRAAGAGTPPPSDGQSLLGRWNPRSS